MSMAPLMNDDDDDLGAKAKLRREENGNGWVGETKK